MMEDPMTHEALRIAREKFAWTGRTQERERKPIIDSLGWSDDYGPHLCPRCRGVGWLVKHNTSNYPDLVACDSCDKAQVQNVARCWKVGILKADAPNPRTLKTFDPHNDTAAAVLRAAGTWIRKPFGWFTLTGAPGTGKSHIAESIARYCLTTNVPCVYTTSVYLWEYLGGVSRGAHDDVDYGERYRWIRDVPALVVDEMNVEKHTDFVFKTRRSLFDHRYRAGLDGQGVTVLVSNDAPAAWQDGAIGDRALDTRFVALDTGTVSYRRIAR